MVELALVPARATIARGSDITLVRRELQSRFVVLMGKRLSSRQI